MAATTNHYDLIVIGSDVAGLVAAALTARRGKRVLVMPHGPADGSYRIGQHVLALDNAPVIHTGCPAPRRVFHELGVLPQMRRECAPVAGFVQFVIPGHRLDIRGGFANVVDEVRREWPQDAVEEAWQQRTAWAKVTYDALDVLLSSEHTLVADGFWSRRFLAKVGAQLPGPDLDELAPLPLDHPFRVALAAIDPWVQQLCPAQLGKAAALRIAQLWSEGPTDFALSMRRIREFLLARIQLHSGEVKPSLRMAELVLRRGRAEGITLLGKRERYGCEHIMIATDPYRLLDGPLTIDHLPKPFTAAPSAITPAALRFVLHLEIDERGISPALDGISICLPAAAVAVDEYVKTHAVGSSYLRVQPGSVETTRRVSITHVISPNEDVASVRERVLEELDVSGVLPFARQHVRLVHSPHDGRQPSDGEGNTLALAGETPVLPMEPLYQVHGSPSLGIGVMPQNAGVHNLYFASRLTLPGLGLEGEFAAGTTVAALVAGTSKPPLSRALLLGR